jgi:hypothetical protein
MIDFFHSFLFYFKFIFLLFFFLAKRFFIAGWKRETAERAKRERERGAGA